MNLLHIFFLLILISLRKTAAHKSNTNCTPGDVAVTSYSCTLQNGACRWENSPNNRDYFKWTIKNNGHSMVMSASATPAQQNETSRLETSWICASIHDQYRLGFKYRLQTGEGTHCALSVFTLAESGSTSILLQENTKTDRTQVVQRNITTTTERFKIIFEAKQLAENKKYCLMEIDDVVLQHENTLSPYTTTPPTTSSSLNAQNDEKDDGALSTGAIIGIIVGLLVLFVVVCVAVILLLRKRKAAGKRVPHIFEKIGKAKNGNLPASAGRSVANSACIDTDDAIPAQSNGSQENTSVSGDYYKVPRKTPESNRNQPCSDYKVTDVPESSNYYSRVPQDKDCTPILQPSGKAKRRNPDYELATVVDSDVGYSSVVDIDLKESKPTTAPADAYAKVKTVKGDNYNNLSYQNPRFAPLDNTADDTYNHLQDQDNVYKVPRSDGKQAPMTCKPDKKVVGSSDGKSGYVAVSMKGKGKAPLACDSDYNHLNLKDGRPAISAASEGHGQGQDVYNHLSDQSDEYNRVDFEGRALHITGDESGNYNHLADFRE